MAYVKATCLLNLPWNFPLISTSKPALLPLPLYNNVFYIIYIYIFFLVGLEFELRALCLSMHSNS
jgi:hypothetical protein